MPLWHGAALRIAQRMEAAGVDPALPILVAGHSYGGAVATLLTALLRNGNTARPLRLVTFGAPIPGDERLQRILRMVPQWHYSTQDDPVPQTPLRDANVIGLAPLVGNALIAAWQRWQPPRLVRVLDATGTFPPLVYGGLLWTVLRDIALAALNQSPGNPFPQHGIDRYLAILRQLNPGLEPWPIPAAQKDELKNSPTSTFDLTLALALSNQAIS
jgi:pimeloyl-ACP methyl ester carboxylesterase